MNVPPLDLQFVIVLRLDISSEHILSIMPIFNNSSDVKILGGTFYDIQRDLSQNQHPVRSTTPRRRHTCDDGAGFQSFENSCDSFLALLRPRRKIRPVAASSCASTTVPPLTPVSPIQKEKATPKRLLSIDGGGIRGLSSLILLKHIMIMIKNKKGLNEEPLPCQYFDMIGGTNTGGLIAIMLGRLEMSVNEAMDAYLKCAKAVFSDKKFPFKSKMFKTSKFEALLKKMVMEKLGQSDGEAPMRNSDKSCKTFVCAGVLAGDCYPRLFRTYQSPRHVDSDCKIWQAARATTAVPIFFKPVHIGLEDFIDGGIQCNNPIEEVYKEGRDVFGFKNPSSSDLCIVSLGTGLQGTPPFRKLGLFGRYIPIKLAQTVSAIAMNCEDISERFRRNHPHSAEFYYRFNVQEGMGKVRLDEWEKVDKVMASSIKYVEREDVQLLVEKVVNALCGDDKKGTD